MRYIFVGQGLVGGAILERLVSSETPPAFAVTLESTKYPFPDSVIELCAARGIDIEATSRFNKDHRLLSAISNPKIDAIFCCGWDELIREPLLSMPTHGWVNLHGAFLPQYRGAWPIEWQLINGETSGGCTAHFMTPGFDDGPIVAQQTIRIDITDDGETLRQKYGALLGELALRSIEILTHDPHFRGTPQNDSNASYAPEWEHLREIDWAKPAMDVYNLVRALSPYWCAQSRLAGHDLRIAKVAVTQIRSNSNMIGQLQHDDDGRLLVGAADYFVKILSLKVGDRIVEDYVDELA